MSKMSKNKTLDTLKNTGALPASGEISNFSQFSPLPEKLDGMGDVEKTGKFKRSGHLTDEILKYNYPKDKQPSIFDTLKPEIQKKIEELGTGRTQIVEGIKLSPSETKVIDCLCKLLQKNSQTLDPKKEDYYTGNAGYEMETYGGCEVKSPKLHFTLYEITKEYKGGGYIGGRDIKDVIQILTELDKKRFLLNHIETTKDKVRIVREFKTLIHIVDLIEWDKENVEQSKKEAIEIFLNPIFRNQIDSKFILYPNDINRRTIIAYGSPKISVATIKLRDYLMRELSAKRYSKEVKLERLYYVLAEKAMREHRLKKVKTDIEKALKTVINLGILLSYEIKTGATGDVLISLSLNKDWE